MDKSNSLKKRVAYIDLKYKTHLKSICLKVIRTYPPVPLESNDLYNIVLYKVARDFIKINKGDDEKLYIMTKAKGHAKNACRVYLTRKHQILNKAVPMKERYFKVSDSVLNTRLKIKDFTFTERKIFKELYLENKSKYQVITQTGLTRRELEKIISMIKIKIKKEN